MSKKSYNIVQLLKITPNELATWLEKNYLRDIPVSLETPEELKEAGKMLGQLTNDYSFLKTAATFANLAVRDAKRKKLEKNIIDDYISRRDLLDNFADITKAQYNAISRMATVKKQVDDEIKMI